MPDVTRCAWPQSAFRPVWFRRGLNVNLSALNQDPSQMWIWHQLQQVLSVRSKLTSAPDIWHIHYEAVVTQSHPDSVARITQRKPQIHFIHSRLAGPVSWHAVRAKAHLGILLVCRRANTVSTVSVDCRRRPHRNGDSNPGALCCESSQFNLIAIHRCMCDKIQFAHSFIISVL